MNHCILILVLILGVSSQQISRASASASVRASYSISETSFSSSLQSATEKLSSDLESDPKNIDAVLERIGSEIIEELEKIASAVISGDDIDAGAISLEFGAAVNASLYDLVGIQGFGNLDVESVTSQVETQVKKIIEGVDGSSKVSVVTEDLGNAVLGAIGDGISEVTGASFTYKFTVEANSPTPSRAPSPSQKSNLLILLEAGKIQQVVKTIKSEIASSTSDTILEFFVQASANETLTASLIEVFAVIFADANFDFEILGPILIEFSEISGGLSYILQEAIISAAEKNKFNGLVQFISIAFKQQPTLTSLLVSALEDAISTAGCTTRLGNILVRSKNAFGDESEFKATIASSENTSLCLTDAELERGDLGTAFDVLISSDIETIISTFSFAIRADQESQVSQLLVKFFESETYSQQNLTVLIASFLQQIPDESSSILLDTILSTSDTSKVVAAFKFGLVGNDTDSIDTFVSLIADSVSGSSCGLSDIVEQVFADSTSDQVKAIIAELIVGGAEACIPDNAIPTINSESTPVVEPVVTPSPEPTPTPITELITQPNPKPISTPITESASTPAPSLDTAECIDITPPGGYSCTEQAKFGKCKRQWMKAGGFCTKTCGFCQELYSSTPPSPTPIPTIEKSPSPIRSPAVIPKVKECSDITPPGPYSCSEQAKFGKCNTPWMLNGGFCAKTCGSCCDDIPPPGEYSCAQQKKFGKCKTSWMIEGKFCKSTCGNCDVHELSPSPTSIPDITPIIQNSLTPQSCDCGCNGCDAEYITTLTKTIVKEVVAQVLEQLRE